MRSAPLRPAREIDITTRRKAREDPANYDHLCAFETPATPGQPHTDILNSHPGQPAWWPAFCKTAAGLATAGVLLFLAGLYVPGAVLIAGPAATWAVLRVTSYRTSCRS